MGVLRPAADFRHQAALDKRREARSRSARRHPDTLGYLGRRESGLGTGGECAKDNLVPFVPCRRAPAYGRQGDSKMRPDFFKLRRVQSTLMASGGHSLNSAAPLLDQSQFLKYPADDTIAEFGDTFLDVFNREAKGKQAGVFDLQAIVEQGHADGGAVLRVVGVHNCVHDGFADRNNRKRPQVGSLYRSDDRFASHVLSQERNGLLRGRRKIRPDFGGIQYPAAVAAREPSGLDPRIREMSEPRGAEEKDSPGGWHNSALVAGRSL